MTQRMDGNLLRTAESLSGEIAAITRAVQFTAGGPVMTDAEELWIRARSLQQAANDIATLAAALEVLARRAKHG